MKHVKSLLVPALLFAVLLMASCNAIKPGCIIQDKAVAVATDTIVEKLQCKNPAAVKADMVALIGSLGLCKVKTGPIASVVCPILVKSIVDNVVVKVIPAGWQCSAEHAKAELAAALTAACNMIPVSEN